RSLLDACDERQRSLVCALLSGLRLEEAAALRWTDVDLQQGWMQAGVRRVVLPAALKLLWKKACPREGADTNVPIWSTAEGRPHTAAQLDALVRAAAVYAGLSSPEEVDAEALRHTYLAYLSRQGLDVKDLVRLAGTLTDEEYSLYSMLKPPGTVLAREQVNTVYPVL
ncbi:MAG TPA: site-specific integrase, partial [Gammaproteobacteria bacterium]|nr:site-specific integrase [Gammaproteobacteria bacterium]